VSDNSTIDRIRSLYASISAIDSDKPLIKRLKMERDLALLPDFPIADLWQAAIIEIEGLRAALERLLADVTASHDKWTDDSAVTQARKALGG
jgi:hypothetical protein